MALYPIFFCAIATPPVTDITLKKNSFGRRPYELDHVIVLEPPAVSGAAPRDSLVIAAGDGSQSLYRDTHEAVSGLVSSVVFVAADIADVTSLRHARGVTAFEVLCRFVF